MTRLAFSTLVLLGALASCNTLQNVEADPCGRNYSACLDRCGKGRAAAETECEDDCDRVRDDCTDPDAPDQE